MVKTIHRFEVWWVNMEPTKGSEIRKTRPCVIISPDELAALKTVIVAPMTSQGFDFPSRISCEFAEKQALILLDQMRAVDKDRLLEKMGILEASVQKKVISCLLELFAE
ncbi:MAG: type II toxin-antitoxin system PemK/MazF family toxin [SAR324 cluster bacterium]|nr:type II toxin-antitoxin system PemK/MazF family toxin [SAR324 cluster bacterium]MEC8261074.1 type II toxin-antitoxin system PemK/MazF family toxin [SAR324 cluster bacterium]MEC8360461.1 type II toxin-antitoxin system PemK/MazF family toxin [SAR324 cluster bacterium]MEC8543978.1 type II toxin-antitoxin system PemK/MazF family toxin [SAR324 cluster bacterium]MEC8594803.1 type II toxin-antitoxin system PemK/MazF family toxin [SAR324 cluster bacterium]